MTTIEVHDGLRAGCDLCGVPAGDWCVYIAPQTVSRTPSTEHLFVRAGTPMQTLHGGRLAKVRELARKARQKARTDELDRQRLDEGRIRYGAVWAAWTAERAFDRAEEARLATWLRHHAHLLISTGES